VFERYVNALNMWFHIPVYRPAQDDFVAVFDVITKRKRAEASLRESEAPFRARFALAPGRDGCYCFSSFPRKAGAGGLRR